MKSQRGFSAEVAVIIRKKEVCEVGQFLKDLLVACLAASFLGHSWGSPAGRPHWSDDPQRGTDGRGAAVLMASGPTFSER